MIHVEFGIARSEHIHVDAIAEAFFLRFEEVGGEVGIEPSHRASVGEADGIFHDLQFVLFHLWEQAVQLVHHLFQTIDVIRCDDRLDADIDSVGKVVAHHGYNLVVMLALRVLDIFQHLK